VAINLGQVERRLEKLEGNLKLPEHQIIVKFVKPGELDAEITKVSYEGVAYERLSNESEDGFLNRVRSNVSYEKSSIALLLCNC
jgi:hypothetical protein